MTKNLVIVESPAKARTIEKYLGKDFTVKSCNGHVRDLPKKDISIDLKNNYEPNYVILVEKKAIVQELKKYAKESEKVWLATDEDREGEAISWHLVEALNLDKNKICRISFNEITKSAVLKAIQLPREINRNLVDAQQARRVLDRIVGYQLSPLLWKKIKPALSAGRVQSVAVRIIVEREEEIKKFDTKYNFRVLCNFFKTDDNLKNTFLGELSHRFSNKEEAKAFLSECINFEFFVKDIEKKPTYRSPSAPFTTSSLQQESSRKLGFAVSKTMLIAQQLYETGKITYMRTDSVNLSDLAIKMCQKVIQSRFGDKYLCTRKYVTKSKGAQEAHEAIRPTEFQNQEIEGTKEQKNLYNLIWKRTIASQMSNAEIEKTQVSVNSPNPSFNFLVKGEVVKFDGFLRVYVESMDDAEDENGKDNKLLPDFKLNEKLNYHDIAAIQKYSQPPARYTEASLVKSLEEKGIGRPSTYAPTISTIQKRGYVVCESRKGSERSITKISLINNELKESEKEEIYGTEKNKLFPTDLGIIVNQFLSDYFQNIIDYQFTANIEDEFDEIAQGKIEWRKMIDVFYKKFHPQVEKSAGDSKKYSGERLLGVDPSCRKNVYVKVGKYGPVVQIGETNDPEKPKFASLLNLYSLDEINLEQAIELFSFPRSIGKLDGVEVIVNVGPYGPYVKKEKSFYQIPKNINPLKINLEQAKDIIEKKEFKGTGVVKEFEKNKDLAIRRGRFGIYIKYKNENYKVPKDLDPDNVTLEECIAIIDDPNSKSKGRRRKGKR